MRTARTTSPRLLPATFMSYAGVGAEGSSTRRGTLAKEGVLPASARLIAGSQFGRSGVTVHRSAQQTAPKASRKASGVGYAPLAPTFNDHEQVLPREEWIALSDGWFQATPLHTGQSLLRGLHSVIDGSSSGSSSSSSSSGQPFLCIYEPRSTEVLTACAGTAEYDLEVSAKMMCSLTSSVQPTHSHFQIVFAFKSAGDFAVLTCDLTSKSWVLSMCKAGEESVLEQVLCPDTKMNQFYQILIQVRGNMISIDVDSAPIFTMVRVADVDFLTGLVGVLAKGGVKFAIKGWKVRAVSRRTSATSSSLSSAAAPPAIRSSVATIFRDADLSKETEAETESVPKEVAPFQLNGGKKTVMSLAEMMARRNSAPAVAENLANSTSADKGLHQHQQQQQQRRNSIASIYSQLGGGPVPVTLPLGGGGPSHDEKVAKRTSDIPAIFSESGPALLPAQADATSVLCQSHERAIVDTVMRDVVERDLGVSFEDIAALSAAKSLLSEAVILPLLMPEFFTGIRQPWKGVLLFGPPGTGKTLLAKAVCSLNRSSFFNCPSSSLTSKYRGESEKIVRCLFEAARLMAPSVIFLDEIDALVGTRGEGEHEASRRLKTELFSQMDGISSSRGQRVMVLATTNCPWDLDEAMRRRLEKRIFIPLPDATSRSKLFNICLKEIPVSDDVSLQELVERSEGYSGADIHIVCREAAMMPMRRLLAILNPAEMQALRQNGQLNIPKVVMQDLCQSLSQTRPSVSRETSARYSSWELEFGSK